MGEIRSETVDRAQQGGMPDRIPLWLRGWSLEATLPRAADIENLRAVAEPGTEIYLSALPRIAHEDQLAAAAAIHAAGFEPVLHIAARKFSSESELGEVLEAGATRAGVRKCLVIAGDIDPARGPFASSLDLLLSPVFANSSMVEVGLGGYPEGHPYVQDDDLAESLAAKLAAIREAGMVPNVVSQFCFDAERVLHWLGWLRTFEPTLPVRLGLAGPTSPTTLMKIALRCWVDLPAAGLKAAPNLMRGPAPDRMVADIDAGLKSHHEQGPLELHFYTFGGLAKTARWAKAAATAAELAR